MEKVATSNQKLWEEDHYNFLSEHIFLYKGKNYLINIVKTANEITNDDFNNYDLSAKNQMINHIFIFEVKLRRIFNNYIELIEKLAFAALKNLLIIESDNAIALLEKELVKMKTFGTIIAFFKKPENNLIDKKTKKSNKKRDPKQVKEIKIIANKFFKYFQSLSAIDNTIKSTPKFLNAMANIKDLRNFIYHHDYLFDLNKTYLIEMNEKEVEKSLSDFLKSLNKILSAKYNKVLFKKLNQEINDCLIELNIKALTAQILYEKMWTPIIKIFQTKTDKFFFPKANEFANNKPFYTASKYEDMLNFRNKFKNKYCKIQEKLKKIVK